MSTYHERMVKSRRKKRAVTKRKFTVAPTGSIPSLDYPIRNNAQSLDTRSEVPPPAKKYEADGVTVAVAYNKGPYAVILKNEVKDIGK